MLKQIAAALLAASLLAAPALAADTGASKPAAETGKPAAQTKAQHPRHVRHHLSHYRHVTHVRVKHVKQVKHAKPDTAAMKAEQGHQDTSRVDTMQRKFLTEGNLDLHLPLRFSVYGDDYTIPAK